MARNNDSQLKAIRRIAIDILQAGNNLERKETDKASRNNDSQLKAIRRIAIDILQAGNNLERKETDKALRNIEATISSLEHLLRLIKLSLIHI